jgi:protein-tyrosine phosphatase
MFSIPWQCYHPSDTAIAEFLTVLHENPRKKIFVHCEYGSDRTGMSIAAHRMSDEGWSPEEARREMKAFGFNRSHRVACRGLSGYEKNFPAEFKTSPQFENLRSVRPIGDSQSQP